MIKSNIAKAHLAIIGANILFGLNYSVAKGVMPNYLQPAGFTLLRVVAALVLFFSLNFFRMKRDRILREDWPRVIAAGLLGVAINQLMFLTGLRYTSPIDSAIIMTLNPVLVMLIASLAIGEKITPLRVVGIVVGATGALMIIASRGAVSFSSEYFLGNLLTFGNALAYAGYLVVVKPLMVKYKPVVVMQNVFLVGLIAVLPFGVPDLIQTNWHTIPPSIYAAIAFVLIGPTFLAYLFNTYGLQYVRATTVSIYIYSQPVIATLVAVVVGQDGLSTLKIVAAILVFVGVYLVSKRTKGKPEATVIAARD